MKKIYILGSGAMATAMAKGLANSGFRVVLVSRTRLENCEFENEIYGPSYSIESKDIILAFKPYALSEVSAKLEGRANCALSVLARTDLESVKNAIKAEKYAICMPNLAAQYNASITPFLGDSELAEIIKGFGKAILLDSKAQFDTAGVISGCVPAFLALVAESLSNGAVLGGIKANTANELVAGVFESSAKMLANSHPALFKERVCSPAGTTIEGIASLEKNGVRWAFIEALQASINKQKG